MKTLLGGASLLCCLLLTMARAEVDYPSVDQLFLDTLQVNVSPEISSVASEKAVATSIFKAKVEALSNSSSLPQVYQVTYQLGQETYFCLGSVVLNSDRLNVATLPNEYRDRAGLVLLGECREGKNGALSQSISPYYIVLPLDKTLPVMNGNRHTAYEIYKKQLKQAPTAMCLAKSFNSRGVPRSQSFIHHVADKVIFNSVLSTSSFMREEVDGSISHQVDRAIRFEGDVDRGSLHEIKDSLDFLIDEAEGSLSFAFDQSQCSELKKGPLYSLGCYTRLDPKHSTVKNKDGELLRDVYVQFETQQVDRLTSGSSTGPELVREYFYTFNYTLVFGRGSRERIYKIATRYAKSPLGQYDECRIK